tara:strand:- start:68 stop:400 length:333 start_codon:yes stop_codon:yes gene_type:complete
MKKLTALIVAMMISTSAVAYTQTENNVAKSMAQLIGYNHYCDSITTYGEVVLNQIIEMNGGVDYIMDNPAYTTEIMEIVSIMEEDGLIIGCTSIRLVSKSKGIDMSVFFG